jgi:ABC-type bacteriocin/lantibiotic exporter with double-glycine peptidase domain
MAMGLLTIAGTAGSSGEKNKGLIGSFLEQLQGYFARESDLIVFLAITAGILFLAKSVLSLYISRRVLHFLSMCTVKISQKGLVDFLQKPLVFSQNRSSQELAMSLTQGISSSVLGILGSLSSLASEVGLLVLLGVGLFAIDPALTFFSLTYFALMIFGLQRVLSGIGVRSGRERTLSEIQSTSLIQESVASFREMYVANKFQFTELKFLEIRNRNARSLADTQWVGLVPKYALECGLIIGVGLLAVYQFAKNESHNFSRCIRFNG